MREDFKQLFKSYTVSNEQRLFKIKKVVLVKMSTGSQDVYSTLSFNPTVFILAHMQHKRVVVFV